MNAYLIGYEAAKREELTGSIELNPYSSEGLEYFDWIEWERGYQEYMKQLDLG